MGKPKLKPTPTPKSTVMPVFQLTWNEAAYLYTVIREKVMNGASLTLEEMQAKNGLLQMFERALANTEAPKDITPPWTRCALCSHVFIGRTKDRPPSKEEWEEHIKECK